MTKETQYTHRGFDTQTDAETFKRFLTFEGYIGINIGFDDATQLWQVYFYTKF